MSIVSQRVFVSWFSSAKVGKIIVNAIKKIKKMIISLLFLSIIGTKCAF